MLLLALRKSDVKLSLNFFLKWVRNLYRGHNSYVTKEGVCKIITSRGLGCVDVVGEICAYRVAKRWEQPLPKIPPQGLIFKVEKN